MPPSPTIPLQGGKGEMCLKFLRKVCRRSNCRYSADINGNVTRKHSEAFSFQVATTDQAENDRYWNAFVGNVGEESQCGWSKDEWGISWQITPVVLTQAIAGSDPQVAQREFEAMMTMKKIDIAKIEAAIRG